MLFVGLGLGLKLMRTLTLTENPNPKTLRILTVKEPKWKGRLVNVFFPYSPHLEIFCARLLKSASISIKRQLSHIHNRKAYTDGR